ncbi:MAG: type IV pilus assembly protein PilM [Desulfobacterota bacterium]|nr:type IV pilus assembly protein PilM [Thermodesulfobacteriota bacterium]
MPETIGLDIGSHSIKLVGLKKTSRGPFLSCLGLKRIPQGIDREDTQALAILLRDLMEETGLQTKKVRLTVSGSGIQIRRLTLPAMPKRELAKALPWEMKSHLPYPPETAQIRSHLLGEFVEEGTKRLDLLVVACPNSLIDRTLSIATGAGLRVSHLDVNAFALWNLLLLGDRLKIGETTALIDLGSEKISLYLFKDLTLQFSREITPAGADLTRAITDGIPFERDLAFLFEKAEKIKEEVGIPSEVQGAGTPEREEIDLSKIAFLMRPVLERWVSEIGRSFDFYQTQFYGERIDRVLLTGGGAHLKNLSPYLEGELGLPVEIFNPLKGMPFEAKSIDPGGVEQRGSMFASAAGVALSGPKQIEFLPEKEPLWLKVANEKSLYVAVPILTGLIFLGTHLYKTDQVAMLQRERDEKMAKVEKLEALRTKLALLKEKEAKIAQDLSLYPSAIAPPFPYRRLLREITSLIPENVTLTSLEVQTTSPPLTKTGQDPKIQETVPGKRILHLKALAFGPVQHGLTAIAQIIEGLERSPFFHHVKLNSTNENRVFNHSAVEFEILCEIEDTQISQEKP